MPESISSQNQKGFLTDWVSLNFIGCAIGLFLISQINLILYLQLEDYYEFSATRTFLVWLPLGLSIGTFQWLYLRKMGIKGSIWIITTALSVSFVAVLFSWIRNFDSFDYREYQIPFWVINLSSALAMPVGGAIIGGVQSFALKRHITELNLWIRAYVLGFALLVAIAFLILSNKAIFLNLFEYPIELYPPSHPFQFLYVFVGLRWVLFYSFTFLSTTLFIAALTSRIIMKQAPSNDETG